MTTPTESVDIPQTGTMRNQCKEDSMTTPAKSVDIPQTGMMRNQGKRTL